jgi:hypothetical protein
MSWIKVDGKGVERTQKSSSQIAGFSFTNTKLGHISRVELKNYTRSIQKPVLERGTKSIGIDPGGRPRSTLVLFIVGMEQYREMKTRF